jgi:MarR family transcriptional regulator, organic hydroperoxide resistance regulator
MSELKAYNKHESLGFLLFRAARSMHLFFNKRMQEQGWEIRAEHWGALVFLYEKDGITQTELGNYLCKEKTNITRLIDWMEKEGLVIRKTGKQDRRSKKIYLTKKGNELRSELVPIVLETIVKESSKGLSGEEVELFKALLNKFYNNLEQIINDQKTN